MYVVTANPAAADLSSSSMFTSSQVPYLFSTACSDGTIRFWSCGSIDDLEASDLNGKDQVEFESFYFFEWKLNSTISQTEMLSIEEPINLESVSDKKCESMVKIGNYPLALSCSYNGRFAVAYKKILPGTKTDPVFYVHIYECESTGGSAWKLEDVLCLENIVLPKIKIGKDH